MERSEEAVAAAVLDAQANAQAPFSEIQACGLIRRGAPESEINAAVYDLAAQMYGVKRRQSVLAGAHNAVAKCFTWALQTIRLSC